MTLILNQHITDKFAAYNGDCVEVMRAMPNNSLHYCITSPPFGHSLYTYSATERDMGNGRTYKEFAQHYMFLAKELHRILMPGRLVSLHCMMLPLQKGRDGIIALFDFRGSLIRMMERCGFIFHSEVTIRKDPVQAMQRTKALGLLHSQVIKDSAMSRQSIADYLVTFRKQGDNPERIPYCFDEYYGTDTINKRYTDKNDSYNPYSIAVWQRYAEPVWTDIDPSDTLQHESAREHDDEKHICPLQLTVIQRGIQMWTNPGDTVLDPFGGIGSTPYCAIKMGRKGVMAELKPSYYRQAVLNCQRAEQEAGARTLFDLLDEQETVSQVVTA